MDEAEGVVQKPLIVDEDVVLGEVVEGVLVVVDDTEGVVQKPLIVDEDVVLGEVAERVLVVEELPVDELVVRAEVVLEELLEENEFV